MVGHSVRLQALTNLLVPAVRRPSESRSQARPEPLVFLSAPWAPLALLPLFLLLVSAPLGAVASLADQAASPSLADQAAAPLPHQAAAPSLADQAAAPLPCMAAPVAWALQSALQSAWAAAWALQADPPPENSYNFFRGLPLTAAVAWAACSLQLAAAHWALQAGGLPLTAAVSWAAGSLQLAAAQGLAVLVWAAELRQGSPCPALAVAFSHSHLLLAALAGVAWPAGPRPAHFHGTWRRMGLSTWRRMGLAASQEAGLPARGKKAGP